LHPRQDRLLSHRRYQALGGIPAARICSPGAAPLFLSTLILILFASLPARQPSTGYAVCATGSRNLSQTFVAKHASRKPFHSVAPLTLSASDQVPHYKLQGRLAMRTKLIGTVAVVSTACLVTLSGNAHAEILITTASISRGELVVVGRVRRPRDPNVEIKISPIKTVRVESTSTGGFRWVGPEFPSTCIVKITSGPDTRDVVIQNCGLPGPVGPPGPPGPPGPKGN
jgi:hypothetical protein